MEYASAKRRKRAANRLLHWSTVRARQMDSYGHLRSAICNFWHYRDTPGIQISDFALRLDHKIALSLGGADNDPDNLQILCGRCDNRKTEEDNKIFRAKVRASRQLATSSSPQTVDSTAD